MLQEPPARFRQDLLSTPAEAEGVQYVDVTDPQTGISFRFYDFEHAIALRFNGQSYEEVAAWAQQELGYEGATPNAMAAFAEQLRGLGFLEAATPVGSPPEPNGVGGGDLSRSTSPALEAAEVGAVSGLASPDEPTPVSPRSLTIEAELPAHSLPTPVFGTPVVPDEALPDRKTAQVDVVEFPSLPSEVESAPPAPRPEPLPPFGIANNGRPGGEPAIPAEAFVSPPVAEGSLSQLLFPTGSEGGVPPDPGPAATGAAKPGSARAASGGAWKYLGLFLLVALLAGALGWVFRHSWGPQPPAVNVVSVKPTSVVLWYPMAGTVVPSDGTALSFSVKGKIIERLDEGTPVDLGQVLAKLDGVKRFEHQVNHLRERLLHYQQLHDSAAGAEKKSEARQAANKVGEKQKLLEQAEAQLSPYILTAPVAGQVVKTHVAVGELVAPGAPVVTVRANGVRGRFSFPADLAQAAQGLGFCQVKIGEEGRLSSCSWALSDQGERGAASGDGLQVDFPPGTHAQAGERLYLARARYENVFSLPPGAISRQGDSHKVFVVTPENTVEVRPVSVVEGYSSGDQQLVTQGLDGGDRVVVNPPPELLHGSPVRPRS